MSIDQTVNDILAIKHMLHARAPAADVNRHIDDWTNKETANSVESKRPHRRPAGTGELRKTTNKSIVAQSKEKSTTGETMDIQKIEKQLTINAAWLKKRWSGQGPITTQVAITANQIVVKYVSTFTPFELWLLEFTKECGNYEKFLEEISRIMRSDFQPQFYSINPALEILDVMISVAGDNYMEQTTTFTFGHSLDQLLTA